MCSNNISELWHPLCRLYGAAKQLYPSQRGCLEWGWGVMLWDNCQKKMEGTAKKKKGQRNWTCNCVPNEIQWKCRKIDEQGPQKKMSNCGKTEKTRKYKGRVYFSCAHQRAERQSAKMVAIRPLTENIKSFFDCLRLQISAVFSQRPICFDQDLSPSPRERWKEADKEKNRERMEREGSHWY